MEHCCIYWQISGLCYPQDYAELKCCCKRTFAVLVKKTSTAMEYEYSLKYIHYFFQYVNGIITSVVKHHRIYYGQQCRTALS